MEFQVNIENITMSWKKQIWCLFIALTIFASNTFAFHIVIDPGHGGTDHGATREGVRESDITLEIAHLLADELSKDSDYQVSLTRERDEIVSLSSRSQNAQKTNGDLFLSIHTNSSSDPHASGAEFYFQTQMSIDDENLFLANNEEKIGRNDVIAIIHDLKRTSDSYRSQIFADFIQKNWSQELKVRNRPIKQESFHVLVNVPMPSVLVELGFISNKKERKWMQDRQGQKSIVAVLAKGIKNFKEKMDKNSFLTDIGR